MAPHRLPRLRYVTVHGHRRAYMMMGSGPVLLLLHGLGCDHRTWLPVMRGLARHHTVIAPDLLGHGGSDKPRGDYSLGAYANGMRDLLTVLGVDRATVVGHSFGGGVAMQFAYQYPERTERLVLVSSGGLGPEVSPLIRAITTPGFHQAMSMLAAPGLRHVTATAMRLLAATGLRHTRDLGEVAAIYESLSDPKARSAIRHLTRSVVDWQGQIVSMADRAYLTAAMPMCVIWGEDDLVLPASHAENAQVLAPTARVEVFADTGHFPHKDHPERFAKVVRDFVRATEPSHYDRDRWSELIDAGAAVQPVQAPAGSAPVRPVHSVRRAAGA